ncbi:MAG: hypothetical protein HOP14_01570 [Acidobacteria bacterium]|nr:hypothetical protein [Acidobacteriota bacterium]
MSADGSRTVTVRRFASMADADREDLAYWRTLTPAERILLTWQISREQATLAGQPLHEPGLCRSVARVRRR